MYIDMYIYIYMHIHTCIEMDLKATGPRYVGSCAFWFVERADLRRQTLMALPEVFGSFIVLGSVT